MTDQLQTPPKRGARKTASTLSTLFSVVLLLVLTNQPHIVASIPFANTFGLSPTTIASELDSAFADPQFVDSLLAPSGVAGEESSSSDVECVAQFDASLTSMLKGELWALKSEFHESVPIVFSVHRNQSNYGIPGRHCRCKNIVDSSATFCVISVTQYANSRNVCKCSTYCII